MQSIVQIIDVTWPTSARQLTLQGLISLQIYSEAAGNDIVYNGHMPDLNNIVIRLTISAC